MRHDPNNTNCDKVRYAGSDEVVCTCDEDTPSPSVVMPPGLVTPAAAPGMVTLTGRRAQTYVELEAATRAITAARESIAPLEAHWRACMDAHMKAMLVP